MNGADTAAEGCFMELQALSQSTSFVYSITESWLDCTMRMMMMMMVVEKLKEILE